MRKSKFSDTQIVAMLKDAESGVPVADSSESTGSARQRSSSGAASMGGVHFRPEAAARARDREREAETDVRGPGARERGHQGCPEPKAVRPSAKRQIAEVLVQEHQLSVARACRVVRLSRTAYYQPPAPASRRDAAVIAALIDAVTRYPRWGFWKLFDRLRVEGRAWNHKHVHRVYCALRLNVPRRTTRRVPRRIRQPLTAPPVLNQTWALEFHDGDALRRPSRTAADDHR